MNKDGSIKSASYKSISINDQEILECQRKKYNDIEPIGRRMFGIDAAMDINERAEIFMERFSRHHREPSRVRQKINNIHCNPTTASRNKPIEPKESDEYING
ncbi:hypothetical protein MKW98_024375 [Papaver atlanticum]|uniref:Uncharacterized protein n=1 Tax=Papaver atlanticum TaxID=357466 RepID=A0AAD4XN74_9MAGN|nr:hypothetical protein MKW98_024375 [Papaver atlanticum]